MTNPSVVKIVPHWPNLMGQIREQTFATHYATPLPYCFVLAAVTEALESISFFVGVCGVSHVPGGKFIGNPEILQHFYVFRAYAFMELRLILKHENLIKNFAMWFDTGQSFSEQFHFYFYL